MREIISGLFGWPGSHVLRIVLAFVIAAYLSPAPEAIGLLAWFIPCFASFTAAGWRIRWKPGTMRQSQDEPEAVLTNRELRAFVGVNAEYYLRRWRPVLDGHAGAGFNRAAFLFPGLWLCYRKLYALAFVFNGAILAFLFAEYWTGYTERDAAKLGSFFGLVAGLIGGIMGNRWYLCHAIHRIAKTRSLELEEAGQLQMITKEGGVNSTLTLGMIALYIAAIIAACSM